MYSLKIRPHLDVLFMKMEKQDKHRLELINKKVKQILEFPYHFKPLRIPMHGLRRVHIDTSYVLTYSIDENSKTVTLEDFEHHDNI